MRCAAGRTSPAAGRAAAVGGGPSRQQRTEVYRILGCLGMQRTPGALLGKEFGLFGYAVGLGKRRTAVLDAAGARALPAMGYIGSFYRLLPAHLFCLPTPVTDFGSFQPAVFAAPSTQRGVNPYQRATLACAGFRGYPDYPKSCAKCMHDELLFMQYLVHELIAGRCGRAWR